MDTIMMESNTQRTKFCIDVENSNKEKSCENNGPIQESHKISIPQTSHNNGSFVRVPGIDENEDNLYQYPSFNLYKIDNKYRQLILMSPISSIQATAVQSI